MKCKVCQHPDNFVVRTDAEDDVIKRRRQCSQCGHRWTTYEATADVADEIKRLKDWIASAPVAQVGR
jgi:transcriptional regulator NrdR family protein